MTAQPQVLSLKYSRDTLIAATIASTAAFTCFVADLPPWAMFVGWVAFFTQPASLSKAVTSGVCVALGILMGMVAGTLNTILLPVVGNIAFAAIVFSVAFIVVSLRGMPIIGNIIAWFLGLITFFAAHPDNLVTGVISLIAVTSLGTFAGYCCFYLQSLTRKNDSD
ncbi:DUF1097 domain-containing protein [Microbulbifer sp. A4B17]|uniref:DUF1097 domain-containing protein n=1 Tax=Microbulbifer sp. A4B17 TaxID=359370 RepID=UPI000D52D853|nr:DUF1097 domain-containing protein [Microbulbifer sp. A4B17]AWF81446.1 DUF1097 domain-containing protein [Microbulbifer sp. A4B17]